MRRLVLLAAVALLVFPAAGQVVIDMPPPPPASRTATAARALSRERAPDPGSVALARYARSRRPPSDVYASAWGGPWRYAGCRRYSPWSWGYPWWGGYPIVVVGHGHGHGHGHRGHGIFADGMKTKVSTSPFR